MEDLREAIDKSQALQPFKDQLLLDITPEGLRIQIVDKQNRPMFSLGGTSLKDYTVQILSELPQYLNTVPNRISLSGHTDAKPYTGARGYTNWELSADRANAARRAMARAGLRNGQVKGVRGFADTQLHVKDSPLDPRNRRISIVVRSQAATALENAIKERQDMPSLEAPAPPAQASAPVTPAHE
jgi:chemotaxis protein MotB